MNSKQAKVLLVGFGLAALCVLYPPRVQPGSIEQVPRGFLFSSNLYRPLGLPADLYSASYIKPLAIDFGRIAVEWLFIGALMGAGLVLFRSKQQEQAVQSNSNLVRQPV